MARMKVIPLRYGTIFKKAFRDPEVFSGFARDVLGIPVDIAVVHQEFSYPTAVGQVKVAYDLFGEDTARRVIVELQHIREPDFFDRFLHYHLVSIVEQAQSHQQYRIERDVFTLVVLTTAPRDRELQFSVAVSDMDPISERGAKVGVYRHRLVFLNPKLIDAQTPAGARSWLELIADSLDGEVDASRYHDPLQQRVLHAAEQSGVTPEELARIKDEAAWEESRRQDVDAATQAGVAAGIAAGALQNGRAVLLRLLTRRGITLTDTQRARVEACEDGATLDAWIDRAVDATDIEHVLREA